MSQLSPETSADPARLTEALPASSGPWERTDSNGGIVEYRIADDDGVCTAAKLVVPTKKFPLESMRARSVLLPAKEVKKRISPESRNVDPD